MKMNLQFFAEDIDFDALEKEINEQFPDEEQEEEVIPEEQEETEQEEEVEEETEEQEEEEVSEENSEKEEEPQQFQNSKQNEAFKNLRLEKEKAEREAAIVRKIAEKNGMTTDEVIKQFEERELESQAKEQNVPVDVLKRINTLEQDNTRMSQQAQAERFEREVSDVVSKENLQDSDVENVFQYMADNGYVKDGQATIPFADAYYLANRDTIIERKVQETRQKELGEKKKRQESSPLPNDGSVTQGESIEDEVLAYLKEEGHI